MKRPQTTALIVSSLVVAGLVVLAWPAVAGSTTSSPVTTTAKAQNRQISAYPEGAAEYDAATAALPLPLPAGYNYPADPEVTGPWADTLAWDHWLAATADAAQRAQQDGDINAVATHQSAMRTAWDLHFSAQMAENAAFVLDAINEGNFTPILQMFQVPAGMTRP